MQAKRATVIFLSRTRVSTMEVRLVLSRRPRPHPFRDIAFQHRHTSMLLRPSLMQSCVGFALVVLPISTLRARAGTAPARSTVLGVTLPTGTTSSGNFFYREAARYTLKFDATRQSVTLGVSLELFRLPMTGAPQSEIVTMVRDAGWTVTIADSTRTVRVRRTHAASPSTRDGSQRVRDRIRDHREADSVSDDVFVSRFRRHFGLLEQAPVEI